ncbi:winged helix-turn-helix transcriptional regulator [Pseudomonas tumuqii]|uniref:winged helix-turn-helix transcriptional regulator n=1 Tax=Pseudomonas tumuqii TaxID=2715755 RepID=UPI0015573695|nr:winged helix-turn-helix transcriptional regulator [Pseudomonas tumuqii]
MRCSCPSGLPLTLWDVALRVLSQTAVRLDRAMRACADGVKSRLNATTSSWLGCGQRVQGQDGIVHTYRVSRGPPEYTLTELGHALGPTMAAQIDWAELRHKFDNR